MSDKMRQLFDSMFLERVKARTKPIDTEVVDSQHREMNSPGYINRTFGKMGSKDNVLAR